jgi:hypothetical protein
MDNKARHAQHIMEIWKAPLVPFNLFLLMSSFSVLVKLTSDELVIYASNAGLGKNIKKFDVLFIDEKRKMLA